MPDLRQLRAFVAVAEELNFTRAAERLHLAQQAVSKTVRSLEDELGVALLERTTREVRLTAAGAALLADGRDVLAAAESAFARARATALGLTGTVRVGVSPALGAETRAALVVALRDGSDEVAVSLLEVRPSEVVERLRERHVEAVVARTSSSAVEVDSCALRPTPTALYVPGGHRLAGRGGDVPLRSLDGERLLVWNPVGTPFTDLLLGAVSAAGASVEPVEARVLGGEHGFAEVAERGLVAIGPAGGRLADGVVELPLAEPLTLPLVLQWLAGPPPAAVVRLRERLSA